jgi:hypothetical protein
LKIGSIVYFTPWISVFFELQERFLQHPGASLQDAPSTAPPHRLAREVQKARAGIAAAPAAKEILSKITWPSFYEMGGYKYSAF